MATTGHHESNRDFYDRISKAYDLLSDSSEKPAREAGLRELDLKPGEKVLEIGCGTGNELLEIARRVQPGGLVRGIDISGGMLDVAREKIAKEAPAPPIELTQADARDLPFPPASFDAVYCSFTLELFQDEDIPIVLGQVRKVLKPGGRLAVVSMLKRDSDSDKSLIQKTYGWLHRHFPHIVDCRPLDVERVLSAAGFRSVRRVDLEIWTLPVTAVIAR